MLETKGFHYRNVFAFEQLVSAIRAVGERRFKLVDPMAHYNIDVRIWCVAFIATVLLLSSSTPRARDAGTSAVLVELFTSEGCSSCPPADTLLARLASDPANAGATIVPLGEHVDYWDELGWRDRFSSPAFTARQQAYAHRFAGDGPYTPQLVVDGRIECVGSDASSARRAITKTALLPHGTIAVELGSSGPSGLHVVLRASDLPQKPTDRADVFVAITEDRLRSDVTRGENHGRTLTHTAVVRRLDVIGTATGSAASLEQTIALGPDWRREAMHLVAFVQERRTGAVLAAVSAPVVAR
jgi:hypothetical protein